MHILLCSAQISGLATKACEREDPWSTFDPWTQAAQASQASNAQARESRNHNGLTINVPWGRLENKIPHSRMRYVLHESLLKTSWSCEEQSHVKLEPDPKSKNDQPKAKSLVQGLTERFCVGIPFPVCARNTQEVNTMTQKNLGSLRF